jgi:predicted N-acyltransferase
MFDFLKGNKKVEQKPVYVINGFLDSGKTSFIRYTIGQPYFQVQGTTLLIICEEGEEEYRKGLLAETDTVLEIIDDLEDFTTAHLMELEKKYRRKYEEKIREMEQSYDRRLRQERANFQRMLKMGLQQGDDAAIMAIDDVFDVNECTAAKFHERHIYYVNKMAHMAVVEDRDDPNMEWTKDTIDRKLLQIVGKDNFVPWEQRMGG